MPSYNGIGIDKKFRNSSTSVNNAINFNLNIDREFIKIFAETYTAHIFITVLKTEFTVNSLKNIPKCSENYEL